MAARLSPADVFRALADEQRLRMLEFVASGDPTCCSTGQGICACDIEGHVGLAQATVSHHMRLLAEAGLVNVERRGRNNFYSLNPQGFALAKQFAGQYLNLARSPKLTKLEVA